MTNYKVTYHIKRNGQEFEAHHFTEAESAADAIKRTREFIEANRLPHAFRPKAKKIAE